MAAVLAAGEGAVLGPRGAGALWGLTAARPGLLHVTVPGRGGRKGRSGLVVHRALLPRPRKVGELAGIPVASPSRTLIDLADVLSRRGLERALDEAEYLGLDWSKATPGAVVPAPPA